MDQLPALRRFYEQVSAMGLAERFETTIEAFGASLHHAEFLKIVYTGHAFRRTPPELEQALGDVQSRFETLRDEVARERARGLRSVPAAKPAPRAEQASAAKVPTTKAVPAATKPRPKAAAPRVTRPPPEPSTTEATPILTAPAATVPTPALVEAAPVASLASIAPATPPPGRSSFLTKLTAPVGGNTPTKSLTPPPEETVATPIVKGGMTLFAPSNPGVLRRVGPASGHR